MKINEAIVHRIDKKRQGTAIITLRKDVLPKDEVLISLVEKSCETYGSNPNRGVGIFQPNGVVYPFSTLLENYLKSGLEFTKFTHDAMNLLEKQINSEPFATGGYVIFIDYVDSADKHFFMVVILKLKGGVGISEVELKLSANWNLDVEHLHEAARISVQNWTAQNGNYISFVRNASTNKSFTQYFKEFIGCTQFIESKIQTTELVKAINSFCRDNNYSLEQARIIKTKAFEYFEEQRNETKPISLVALSMRLNNDNPKEFSDFLESNKIEIGDGFEPNKDSYKHLKRIGGKNVEISISFDRALLGKEVKYNKEEKKLTFYKLPTSLIEELDGEMQS